MKSKILLFSVIALLISCHNNIVQMSHYNYDDWALSIDVPNSLNFTKKDNYSLQFEGNKKILKVMRTQIGEQWDLTEFANQIVGSNRSKLSLKEQNDSLIVYEISKGIINMPAHIFSVHNINGYSILVFTYGLSLDTHNLICKSIHIKKNISNREEVTYNGEYLSIKYNSDWIVDNNPKTQTADVYIGQSNKEFGLWIFRFELQEGVDYKEAMSELANNWKNFGHVNVDWVTFNDIEWCAQDIKMEIEGQECRQISYYTYKDNFVYNIKFGNKADLVGSFMSSIEKVMSSVILN